MAPLKISRLWYLIKGIAKAMKQKIMKLLFWRRMVVNTSEGMFS